MLEGLLQLFSRRPFGQIATDVIDLLIVAYVVYRASGRDFERTPVKVSALARGLAVVVSGLDAGSRVALAEPSSDSSAGGLRKALGVLRGEG